MRVSVRLFAQLRERAGAERMELELPEGAQAGDVLDRVRELTAGIPVVLAVNQEYAGRDTVLAPDDELALIPPVSGGSVGTAHARVSPGPLDVETLTAAVRHPRAGAVVTFLGVTREVPALEYEAYVPMAERQMAEIASQAIERHGLCSAAVEHRIGTVPLSEPSVAIAVSAPHRDAAFAGAREIIDRVKEQVPIWKREEGEWVPGTSPER